MSRTIRLGISTCPNDTFAFHGILERKVDLRDLEFEIELIDVQQLNDRLLAGDFDVAKASFHAALLLSEQMGVFASGSALGFGVGPLLLASGNGTHPGHFTGDRRADAIVLCPGQHTTAALLYQLFHPGEAVVRHVVFSEIMPALQAGEADFGVCIHEGRFTWQEQGLALVEDLGEVWEASTGAPLPLGGILGRLALGESLLKRIQDVLHDSVVYGLEHRDETLPTMRQYAQEFSDDVLMSHVDLYVNDWTIDLGVQGVESLRTLQNRARQVGAIADNRVPLAIIGG